MSQNFDVYMPVLILAVVAVVAFVGTLLVGRLVRPNNPTELKQTPYECGEEPTGAAWSNFNVRFYVIALVFLIFDVEGALMFPVATVYKNFVDIGQGGAVLGSLLMFIIILSLGLVYCWKKGDLDWVKSYEANIDGKDK
ncbi:MULTISPECIES: NADH-quinone oxidoreductase subunit A [Halobacteriovorax]|uniref:NADH-quinone oxidoreductase subunit A n=1 Tax=Halobacteriovorax vibrionivorans TaxID=2152716 RepID=A0ABY0IJF5_9BACT|nr:MULTISPECIES: NADH-quinone oxidoreductase subunit A [Halobacteriovorax]AYF43074.1 NADH-ubiquinone/plastoquinone oxidoreductase, chain 3 [Halobacteriovorax sp. BALOs_7]RZF23098.1 NADH-quinone oxidoreductase subunit A [Halobacteriovorax vibrionivorans]TGD49270.1 NADH-quinone oxidoreductase subunit A [Halobacteriovorax sp. Y22]